MAGKERRISPRKDCAVPLRFRIITNGNADAEKRAAKASAYSESQEGETINLSERGIGFRSRQQVSVGEPLELYFTLPRELTGRSPEQVRCSARVVHVESRAGQQGKIGVGAIVDRFEPVATIRNWDN
jgi:hypothetical protein